MTMEVSLAAVLMHTTGVVVADVDEAFLLQDYVLGVSLDADAPAAHLFSSKRASTANDIEADLLAQFPLLAGCAPERGSITSPEDAIAWVGEVSEHTGYPMRVTVKSRAEACA